MAKSTLATRSMMAAMVIGTAISTSSAAPHDNTQALQDISKYCQTCWRNARLPQDDWSDATQQVFVRLLERVDIARWNGILQDDSQDRREFLRAIDAVKKRTQRAHRGVSLSETTDPSRLDPQSRRDDRAAVEQAARAALSDRQQAIVRLSFDGYAVPEIAAALKTTVARISDEKYKAIRKLNAHFDAAMDAETSRVS
jgi:DNA-directed RNA polymerase specialized sigma subunit